MKNALCIVCIVLASLGASEIRRDKFLPAAFFITVALLCAGCALAASVQ